MQTASSGREILITSETQGRLLTHTEQNKSRKLAKFCDNDLASVCVYLNEIVCSCYDLRAESLRLVLLEDLTTLLLQGWTHLWTRV